MNLRKLIFTQNACYKSGKSMTPKGVVVHSTGANNPWLKRYVGPDDGLLGKNQYNNHWNQDIPDGRQVCVHGFIGKLNDGSVATYQTLPWDMVGWHSGAGDAATAKKNGFSGNNANYLGYIGFEICEDALADKAYFDTVYKEAVELVAYLCKSYGIKPEKPTLICHSEGHTLGIASNHGDVMHWFPKHGKSMDTFRADVKKLLDGGNPAPAPNPPAPAPSGSVQKGSLVKLAANAVYYSGATIPAWVKAQNWLVYSLSGDRAVIDKNEAGTNAICSPVNVKFLSVVGAAAPAPAPAFSPYLVKVTADSLNIRKGAGTSFAVVGAITDKGTYTIVEEANGTGATKWGRLKSGAGWISLDYTQRR